MFWQKVPESTLTAPRPLPHVNTPMILIDDFRFRTVAKVVYYIKIRLTKFVFKSYPMQHHASLSVLFISIYSYH